MTHKWIDHPSGGMHRNNQRERRRLYVLLRLVGFTSCVARRIRDWKVDSVRGQLSIKVGTRIANRALALLVVDGMGQQEVEAQTEYVEGRHFQQQEVLKWLEARLKVTADGSVEILCTQADWQAFRDQKIEQEET